MSADSLATLFTPHLLCPRKLSPENLHINSQTLSGIIAFMITNSPHLFDIPKKLSLDIKAYYSERERKKILSPSAFINESVSDNFAANTVFSFVDHELTAKENQSNTTETALAQLYAYIQGLPESSKKRKLVKQFNKENGHGTPLQVLRSGAVKNKSLGDSIKKHLLVKGLVRSARKSGFSRLRSNSEEMLSVSFESFLSYRICLKSSASIPKHQIFQSPSRSTGITPSRTRLFCTNCETSGTDVSSDSSLKKTEKPAESLKPGVRSKRSFSEPDLSRDDFEEEYEGCVTSTPACAPLNLCAEAVFTPEQKGRKSMSPITRSAQRMCKAMQVGLRSALIFLFC